jgi:hypothetical protein
MSLAAWTWSCLRPYRGRVVMLGGIALVNITLGLLAPWPLKFVVDNVLGGQPLPGPLARLGTAIAGNSQAGLLVMVVVGGLLLQVLTQVVSMTNTQLQVDTIISTTIRIKRNFHNLKRRRFSSILLIASETWSL